MSSVMLYLFLMMADDAIEAKNLLGATSSALKEVSTLAFQCSVNHGHGIRLNYQIVLKRPLLARVQAEGYGRKLVLVSDGKNLWTYNSANHGFRQETPTIERLKEMGPLPEIFLGNVDKLLEGATEVSLKDERYGEDPCQVIRWKHGIMNMELWIDRDKHVRQYVRNELGDKALTQSWIYTIPDLSPKVSKDSFIFTPPEGVGELPPLGPAADNRTLLAEGTLAPDFDGIDVSGKCVKLSDFRGKAVIVNFWYYTCGPCRAEFPHLEKLAQEYKSRGLVVLAVTEDELTEQIRVYLEDGKYTFNALHEEKRQVSNAFGVSSNPTNYLIGPEGKIVFRSSGFKETPLREALERLLGEKK